MRDFDECWDILDSHGPPSCDPSEAQVYVSSIEEGIPHSGLTFWWVIGSMGVSVVLVAVLGVLLMAKLTGGV